MTLPWVKRSELEHWQRSATAWADRATMLQEQLDSKPKTRRWPTIIAALWMAIITALVVGSLFFANDNGPVVAPDYNSCIGQAIYENPIPDNQYQELVNALYTCGVYG